MHDDFPIPKLPPTPPAVLPSSESPALPNSGSLQASQIPQENGPSPRNLPPVPAFDSSTTSRVPESQPTPPPPGLDSIPDLLIQQFNYITSTLRTSFSERPPHTIQRFAELVLSPTKHYKTLPAWLRALDRVVSVSSTADIFPLPTAQALPGTIIDSSLTNGMVNGIGSATGGGGILWTNPDQRNGFEPNGLGSDESLGGALLTPIPWLKNGVTPTTEMGSSPLSDPLGDPIDTPSSGNSPLVPEREDGAVTQGELIRQEQQAGIVPVSQAMSPRMGTAELEDGEMEDSEATPHARGPDIVGAEDIGLQSGRNVQVNINRSADVSVAKDTSGTESAEGAAKPVESAPAEQPGDDEDIVLTDVDGKTEEQAEEKADATGENVGPDAAETSAA